MSVTYIENIRDISLTKADYRDHEPIKINFDDIEVSLEHGQAEYLSELLDNILSKKRRVDIEYHEKMQKYPHKKDIIEIKREFEKIDETFWKVYTIEIHEVDEPHNILLGNLCKLIYEFKDFLSKKIEEEN